MNYLVLPEDNDDGKLKFSGRDKAVDDEEEEKVVEEEGIERPRTGKSDATQHGGKLDDDVNDDLFGQLERDMDQGLGEKTDRMI